MGVRDVNCDRSFAGTGTLPPMGQWTPTRLGRAVGVQIRELIWDEWNAEHLAGHAVTEDEMEEVAEGRHFITRARDGLYRIIGQTVGGRMLTAYVAPRQHGTFYVVTARDATARERRTYQQHARR